MGVFILGLVLMALGIVASVLYIKARKNLKSYLASYSSAPAKPYDPYSDRRRSTDQEDNLRLWKRATLIAAGAFIFFGFLTIALDSMTIVPARNDGVVNVLGNVTETLPNGWHPVAPWATVEKVDTTNKPIQLNDDGDVGNGCTSIAIRLASQQIACQDVFVQWQIDPKGDAADLWKTYRGSNDELINNLQNNVILPRLRSEMQKAFSDYDPLAVLQGGKLQDTTTLQGPVENALKGDMPNGVLILDVRFAQIHYSAQTQNKIDSFSQSVADTKIAQQQEQTALAQATTNKNLANDPSVNNPGVQYQNCLNMISSLAAKGQLSQLPQAFTCSQNGSGTPVIIGNGAKG